MTRLGKNIFLYIHGVYGKIGKFSVGKYMRLKTMISTIFLKVGKLL